MNSKQWGDKFETFLIDKHAAQYHGLDDEMPDAYNDWLQEQSHDEIIDMVGEFVAQREAVREIVPSVERIIEEMSEVMPEKIENPKLWPSARTPLLYLLANQVHALLKGRTEGM